MESGAAGDITIGTIGGQQPLRQLRRRVRVSLQVEMRRARAFGATSRRDKEHHRASRKCRRESTVVEPYVNAAFDAALSAP